MKPSGCTGYDAAEHQQENHAKPNGSKGNNAHTMLTKADRKTRIMAKTPTKVLLVLDCTIFLERVWSGAGKSCMWKKE